MAEKEVIYGINPILEVLRVRPQGIKKIFLARGKKPTPLKPLLQLSVEKGIPLVWEERSRITSLAGGSGHQGVAALVELPPYVALEDILAIADQRGEAAFVIILDGVQDPQNLGSLVRAAACLGAHGLVIRKDRACGITGGVYKSSAGAVEHLPLVRVANLAQTLLALKKRGLWLVGTQAQSPLALFSWDFTQPVALILGAEGKGMSRLIGQRCDVTVSIPLSRGISSLNVAVAGAICMYEVARQRGKEKSLPGKNFY